MTQASARGDRALSADVIGGVTTFFTMAYIVVVNPAILSTPGTGLPFTGALTATVLIASSMTLLMGLYARLPFAVAPGMGLNAFFAFTIVLQNKVPWQTALGMVFWAGVLFLVVSATPLREQIALAIPSALRKAAAAGIGLLLTFIGLRNAGLVIGDPATLVRMGTLDHRAVFLLLGIIVAAVLMRRNNPLAFLAAIPVVNFVALGYLLEAEGRVQGVGIARDQVEAPEPLQIWMQLRTRDQPPTEAASAPVGENIDITQISECGPIGDHSRQADLERSW